MTLAIENRPKVSILIPVYNRAKIILETLSSAVNQTYKNKEVIVVDNNSTDGSYEIIKAFAKSHINVIVYQNKENVGPVKNWRICLDYASGEYVKILWSDDLIAPTFIEKTLPCLVDSEDIGFVFTGTEVFNDAGHRSKHYFIGETGGYDTSKFIEGILLGTSFPVSPGNALFRKRDVDRNLLLDVPNKVGSDFKMHAIGNDVLLYLLTAKKYPKFGFINETLSYFRMHETSISISSESEKLVLFYHIAKAYFVENCVCDEKIRKKFNSRLLYVCLRSKFRKKGLISVKDFYYESDVMPFNVAYFVEIVIKALLKKVLGRCNAN